MIASAHLAAGVVSGIVGMRVSAIRGRWASTGIAFAVGLFSHVVLDAIPHAHYEEIPKSMVLLTQVGEGVAIGAVAAFFLRGRVPRGGFLHLLCGLLGALIPDAKFGARLLLSPERARIFEKYGDRFHAPFHAGPAGPVEGWVTQIVAIAVLIAAIAILSKSLRATG